MQRIGFSFSGEARPAALLLYRVLAGSARGRDCGRDLRLFVLPPRSPKLNGAVERANRTHTEEFYQVTPCSLEMPKLNRELRHWGKIYNTVRPHKSLGYLTPQQFLLRASSQRKE